MRYSKEVNRFIADNVAGRRTSELADLVNSKLGTDFTESKMRSYMKNHDLKNGLPTRIKGEGYSYPENVRTFVMEHYVGTGHQSMADMLNDAFGTNYTKEQIKGCYARYKLDSGLTGQYHKGNVPFNKGKKKYWIGGEETQFKKGSIPPNRLPIGSERIDSKDGYIYVKIQDGHLNKNWKQKHVLIWEEHNGPVPKGHAIIFGDGNKLNMDPGNLIIVTRAQLATLNHLKLIQKDADLTRIGITIADIASKANQRRKRV
ncbi:MAG: hypothetical protein K0R46_1833 [Herbinix sp.]|jgi:hypothetical protein|nr:hypothetical protein [Herbinix sp.]